jgi:hypothetical protein
MNERSVKLLQIYFNQQQRSVIESHPVIRDNIAGFIEGYSAMSISGELEDSAYQVIYPIRRCLDYIHSLRLKAKEDALEKINASFEKLTIFDSRVTENLIYINLLFSEGRLPELLPIIKEKLASPEHAQSSSLSTDKDDFYVSIRLISQVKIAALTLIKLSKSNANNQEKFKSERRDAFEASGARLGTPNARAPNPSSESSDPTIASEKSFQHSRSFKSKRESS